MSVKSRTDLEGAATAAGEAVELGRRVGEPDVVALGLALQGRALLRSGRVPEGTALLDGSVAVALDDEVSAVVVGLVLTTAIDAAGEAFLTRTSSGASSWASASRR